MLRFIRTRVESLRSQGRKSKKDLGQNMIEYVGLVVLVAGIVAAIASLGVFDNMKARVGCNVKNVFQDVNVQQCITEG